MRTSERRDGHGVGGSGAPAGASSHGGHETRDVDARRLAYFALGLAALVGVALIVMRLTFDYFAARESASQPPPSTLTARAVEQLPPEPRLQQNPARDLREMRAEEDKLLDAYGWMDREHGVVRLPIEQAMEIVVRRGLPARQDAASAARDASPPRESAP